MKPQMIDYKKGQILCHHGKFTAFPHMSSADDAKTFLDIEDAKNYIKDFNSK